MDRYQNQRSQLNNNMTNSQDSSTPPSDSPSENPNRSASERQNQPQYSNGFTMIAPNQSRRNNLVMGANKEEEAYRIYKETHRAGPVHMNPERLGGEGVTLAQARQKQFIKQPNFELQKKLKREEQKKIRKEEEEAELQQKKDMARQKTERLEQRRRQEEEQRKDELYSDHIRVNNNFLQHFETIKSQSAPAPVNQHVHNTSNVVKVKKNPEELQQEHERVNSAFLDRLERQSRTVDCASSSSSEILQAASEKQSSSHLHSHPVPMSGDAGSKPDLKLPLMTLMSNFPELNRDIVEDILNECNGNYQQAYDLLSPY